LSESGIDIPRGKCQRPPLKGDNMVSKKLEKVLRECAKEEGNEIPEDKPIEDWLREWWTSSPVFEKRLQKWVDKHRIHGSEQKPKEPEVQALQMNVAYIAELKRAIEELLLALEHSKG